MSESVRIFEAVKVAVSNRLNGVTPGIIDSEGRWVLSDFLADTRVWHKTYTITVVPGQDAYPIPMEDYESGVVLLEVTYRELPMRLSAVSTNYITSGGPLYVALDDDRTLRLWPTPAENETSDMKVTLGMTLLPTADIEPPAVIRPYHNALLEGLLGRLMFMADKPWANLKMAPTHAANYDAQKMRLRAEIDRGRTRSPQFAKIMPI